ncbi:MAG: hypothetical protein QM714_02795 [Nocardioides sp.]|uniref:hypothetical protein n=1 Tax=Nocardioides sp. TaxID=35761 RepID=UPI0039E59E66
MARLPHPTKCVGVCTGCSHWQVDVPPIAGRDFDGPNAIVWAIGELHHEHVYGDCPGGTEGRIKVMGQWVERPGVDDGTPVQGALAFQMLPEWWVWRGLMAVNAARELAVNAARELAVNAARELAATGTPGEWVVLGNSIGASIGQCNCGTQGMDGYGHEPGCGLEQVASTQADDAVKITKAVNALPAIGDLLDAVEGLRRHCAKGSACDWAPCRTVRAADALTEALR